MGRGAGRTGILGSPVRGRGGGGRQESAATHEIDAPTEGGESARSMRTGHDYPTSPRRSDTALLTISLRAQLESLIIPPTCSLSPAVHPPTTSTALPPRRLFLCVAGPHHSSSSPLSPQLSRTPRSTSVSLSLWLAGWLVGDSSSVLDLPALAAVPTIGFLLPHPHGELYEPSPTFAGRHASPSHPPHRRASLSSERVSPLALAALSSLDGWVGLVLSCSVHLFSSLSSVLRLLSSHHWGCVVRGSLGRFFFSLARYDPHLCLLAVSACACARVCARLRARHSRNGLTRFSGPDTLPSFDRSGASAPGNAAPVLRAATGVT